MSFNEPYALLKVGEGKVQVSHCDEGRLTYIKDPSELVIAELIPETYGIVACKYSANANPRVNTEEGHLFSLAIDDGVKFGCDERQRVVDIYVSQLSGDGVRPSHYALHFDQLYHWYECVRLLTEAKFRHTALSVSLTYKLAVVLAQHFTPEVSEEHFEGAVPEANEHSVDEESSEHTVVEESSEHTAIEELVPGGYRE